MEQFINISFFSTVILNAFLDCWCFKRNLKMDAKDCWLQMLRVIGTCQDSIDKPKF